VRTPAAAAASRNWMASRVPVASGFSQMTSQRASMAAKQTAA
jgi:hypothetical protein